LLIGKRRDRMDVIGDILRVADNPLGAKKTRLVYQSNLNFDRLSTFLDYLIGKGLIVKNGENMYVTTSKGRDFLRQAEKLDNLL
jgi:predicted transcriptional regulator